MTTTEAPARRRSLTTAWRSGPLGLPAFRLLTAGQFASTLGDYPDALIGGGLTETVSLRYDLVANGRPA